MLKKKKATIENMWVRKNSVLQSEKTRILNWITVKAFLLTHYLHSLTWFYRRFVQRNYASVQLKALQFTTNRSTKSLLVNTISISCFQSWKIHSMSTWLCITEWDCFVYWCYVCYCLCSAFVKGKKSDVIMMWKAKCSRCTWWLWLILLHFQPLWQM